MQGEDAALGQASTAYFPSPSLLHPRLSAVCGRLQLLRGEALVQAEERGSSRGGWPLRRQGWAVSARVGACVLAGRKRKGSPVCLQGSHGWVEVVSAAAFQTSREVGRGQWEFSGVRKERDQGCVER